MKGLNLSQFKKVSSDEKTTTLLHPSGHSIKVVHSALSPKMRIQLSKLPIHMADGGEPDTPEADNQSPAPAQANQAPTQPAQPQAPKGPDESVLAAGINAGLGSRDMLIRDPDLYAKAEEVKAHNNDMANAEAQKKALEKQAADSHAYNQAVQRNAFRVSHGLDPLPLPQMPAQMQMQQTASIEKTPDIAPAPQAPTNQDPYGTQAYSNLMQRGINEQKTGIAQEANALGQEGKEESQIEQQNIQNSQAQQKTYQDHYNQLDQERKSFQQDIQNQHIDPRHYLNSMGTGQKIATGIGLILGGIGSGLTHQPNAALEFLNNQIANDIESQKANLGKSENLLSANLREFGNLHDAMNMTRVMQNDIVSSQLRQAAAQAKDPLSKARALQAAGQLDQQSAPIMSQLAMRKTIVSGNQNGSVDPSTAIRFMVPEKEQEQAYKELDRVQNLNKQRDVLLTAFDKANNENTITNRTAHLGFKPASVAAMKTLIMPYLKDAEGRINEQELDRTDDLIPSPGDSPAKVAEKRQALINFMNEKASSSLLSSYGINPNGSRFSSSGQKKIQERPPKL